MKAMKAMKPMKAMKAMRTVKAMKTMKAMYPLPVVKTSKEARARGYKLNATSPRFQADRVVGGLHGGREEAAIKQKVPMEAARRLQGGRME